jgi:DNA mismatch endonuclease (patch repair protein)
VPDIVDSATRSRIMSRIRSTNTKPELAIRKALHRRGFRYRLHASHVAGKPDIILPVHHAAVFVHGCFWHGHNCSLYRQPKTRPEFWAAKIGANRARDERVRLMLKDAGWRRLVVWECALRGQPPTAIEKVSDRVAKWIKSPRGNTEIRGA